MSSFTKWTALNKIQLKQELAKKGLNRRGPRDVLITRLAQAEPIAIEAKTTSRSLEEFYGAKSTLVMKTKKELTADIHELAPLMPVKARLKKSNLVGAMNYFSIADTLLHSKPDSLAGLLLRLNFDPDKVTIEDYMTTLQDLAEASVNCQPILCALQYLDHEQVGELWEYALKNLLSFSTQQHLTILKSLHTVKEILGRQTERELTLISQVVSHMKLSELSPSQLLSVVELGRSARMTKGYVEVLQTIEDLLPDHAQTMQPKELLVLLRAMPPKTFPIKRLNGILKQLTEMDMSQRHAVTLVLCYVRQRAVVPAELVMKVKDLPLWLKESMEEKDLEVLAELAI
jgi:hypothetical protein